MAYRECTTKEMVPTAETLTLSEIEARCNAATPGPWRVGAQWSDGEWDKGNGPAYDINTADGRTAIVCYRGEESGVQDETDADFIAAARTDVPALLDACRRMRGLLERAQPVLLERFRDLRLHGQPVEFGDLIASIGELLNVGVRP